MGQQSRVWPFEPVGFGTHRWSHEGRKPAKVGAGVPVLPEENVTTLYRPGPEDWGGLDRDSECDRITAELSKVDPQHFSLLHFHCRIPDESVHHQISAGQSILSSRGGRRVRRQLLIDQRSKILQSQFTDNSLCFVRHQILSGDDPQSRCCRKSNQ